MRDKSKQLLVINTGKKKSEQTGMPSQSGTTHIIGGGGLSVNMSDYLLKSIWDKVFEIRTDSQGTEYIFGKMPVVTQYGITMYSGDGVDIPSLASGLPFDGRTIWYNPETNQIEVIGGTGGGSGEGVSNFWDLSGIPSWITNSKPKYTYSEIEGTPDLTKYALASQIPSLSGYATESWVTKQNYATKATTLSGYGITDAYTKTNVDDLLKAYVTLSGSQTITGEKNFTGGLKVNGSPIYYDTEKKYWKLEGDLLVTGGVTMYGSDSSFTPSTIMDALLYDDATLGINSNGQLYVKGGTSGGGLDITALQNYLTQNSYLNVTSGDNRYLKLSGGTITASNGVYIVNFNSTDGKFCVNSYQINGVNKGDIGYLNDSGRAAIYMFNKKGDAAICVGDDGEIYKGNANNFALHKIWHSGNDGSGSGLDADLLDGKHLSDILAANVASATKLQTARTIWGQSFDGTGNIDGVITINQSTTNASILINSTHASLPQSFITFQSNGVDKGNVGWTNASGTHLYNASTRKTLELTNDGELKYGAAANGVVIWRADNSNLSTVNWTASDLYCYCNGAERQFVVSKKSYTWGGMVNSYPLIGTTSAADNNIYTMLAFPHIPYLKNGSRNYNGNSFGSLVRFEGDVTNGKDWDVGCPSESPNNLFIKCDGKNIASWENSGLMGIYVPNMWLSSSMLVLGRTDASLMTNQYAQIGVTDGNIHVDAYKGYGIYLNFYQNNTGVIIDKDCNLLVSGGITMYSDQRKKTILNHVELSLKQIAEAPLIEHYYNSDESKTTHVGSIAQYWASMNDWFCKLDSEGYYTMEIQNAALASAISIARELDRYETKTDKAIKKLKKRICELEEEVERLKAS